MILKKFISLCAFDTQTTWKNVRKTCRWYLTLEIGLKTKLYGEMKKIAGSQIGKKKFPVGVMQT